MLFSDERVAQLINKHFEPVWESVGPVPIVRVEVAGEDIHTRTFGGNVATWVCNSNGRVLDMAPRTYTPATYISRLNGFLELAEKSSAVESAVARQQFLEAWHTSQQSMSHQATDDKPTEVVAQLNNWQEMQNDTIANESKLRPQVHRKLANAAGLETPQSLKHWAYRDLMGLDLDEPYFGLGPALFQSNPFPGE